MHAVWLEERKLSIASLPVPEPDVDEALVRVMLSGICQTDLELCSGYYPFTGVLGHEFVGRVERVNSADRSESARWVGKRVVAAINTSCFTTSSAAATCSICSRALAEQTHCKRRGVLGIKHWHGCHAEYVTVPLANLVEVPSSVPDECAVFAEPLAAALEIQQQVAIRPTDQILIIGAGKLGLMCALTLALLPAQLLVCARHEKQRRVLEERKIRWISEDELSKESYSDYFDLVVDATGNPSGLATAIRVTVPRGRIVLKSTYSADTAAAAPTPVNLSLVVTKELTITGSRCGPMDAAIALLASGRVDPRALIDAVFPLSEGLQAMRRAGEKGALKVLLRMGREQQQQQQQQ